MRPGLSTPFGSKPSLTRRVSAASPALLRLEHRDRGTDRGRRADQRRMTAGGADGTPHQRGAAIVGLRQRQPDETARPVEQHLRVTRCRHPGGQFGTSARHGRDAPDGALGLAPVRPPAARRRASPATAGGRPSGPVRATSPNGLSSSVSVRAPMRDRRRDAFEPQRRDARSRRRRCPQQAPRRPPADEPHPTRRRTSPSRPPSPARQPRRRARSTRTVCLGLRPRQRLDRHLGHRRERAPGAGEQLAEVVAGDVLHHPAAGLEGLAAARHRRHAKEVIARGARLEPARTRTDWWPARHRWFRGRRRPPSSGP